MSIRWKGSKIVKKSGENGQWAPQKMVTSFMDGPLTVTEVRQLFFTTTCVITITTVIINGGMTVPVLTFLQVSISSDDRLRLAEFKPLWHFLFWGVGIFFIPLASLSTTSNMDCQLLRQKFVK